MRRTRRTLKSKRCGASAAAAEVQMGGRRTLARRNKRVRKSGARKTKRGGSALQTASVPVLLLALNQLFGKSKKSGRKSSRRTARRRFGRRR